MLVKKRAKPSYRSYERASSVLHFGLGKITIQQLLPTLVRVCVCVCVGVLRLPDSSITPPPPQILSYIRVEFDFTL